MTFQPGRWLTLLGEFADHLIRNRLVTFFVLLKQAFELRLDVDHFNVSLVVGEEIDSSSTSLLHRVGGVEYERRSRTEMLSASLSCKLRYTALIVGRFNTQFSTNVIK